MSLPAWGCGGSGRSPGLAEVVRVCVRGVRPGTPGTRRRSPAPIPPPPSSRRSLAVRLPTRCSTCGLVVLERGDDVLLRARASPTSRRSTSACCAASKRARPASRTRACLPLRQLVLGRRQRVDDVLVAARGGVDDLQPVVEVGDRRRPQDELEGRARPRLVGDAGARIQDVLLRAHLRFDARDLLPQDQLILPRVWSMSLCTRPIWAASAFSCDCSAACCRCAVSTRASRSCSRALAAFSFDCVSAWTAPPPPISSSATEGDDQCGRSPPSGARNRDPVAYGKREIRGRALPRILNAPGGRFNYLRRPPRPGPGHGR